MDKVKVGFIGCGGIAQFHFGHMEKIENAQVVATCDRIEERANKAADRFKAKPYTSYKEMFEREQLDAVYVCVEPSAHDGMEMMAIERGINLFVQKPMSLDLAYAKDVRDAIADKGLVSAVGFQCRYVDTLPRVKAWLDGQEITQFTYFQQVGGYDVEQVPVELTYGLERIAMYLQDCDNVFDLIWTGKITYGEVFQRVEWEQSSYSFDYADRELLFSLFNSYEKEANRLLDFKMFSYL